MTSGPASDVNDFIVFDAAPPRRPGRPRVPEERTSVSTWIPAAYHDRLIKLANDRDQSVSKTLADILRRALE